MDSQNLVREAGGMADHRRAARTLLLLVAVAVTITACTSDDDPSDPDIFDAGLAESYDRGTVTAFADRIEVGMVGVNVPVPVPVSYYSFGGWKSSLFGDTHIYGPEGINFYTQAKVITSRWPDPSTSTIDLGFPETR